MMGRRPWAYTRSLGGPSGPPSRDPARPVPGVSCRLCWTVAVLVALSGGSLRAQPDAPPAAQPRAASILFVSNDDPDRPYVREFAEGLREGLNGSGLRATLYREFFDQVRFGDDPAYRSEFRAWLHRKYRSRPIDAIVVRQQDTLRLFAQASDNPWNQVPIVYGTLGALTIDISRTHPTASGVVMENFFPRVLEVITTLLPETRRIAAVRGASREERVRDSYWLPQIRAHGLEVMDLAGLPLDEVLVRVRSLPPDTVPVSFTFQQDGAGQVFEPGDPHRLIAEVSNRPLFTVLGDIYALGLVGGPSPDYRKAGRITGAHTRRRILGQPPTVDTIPATDHVQTAFDARALARWGIPESRLPPGSVVHSRPPSLWRDHRGTVLGALAVGAAQTALVAFVLVQRRQRTRVQQALSESHARLQDLATRLLTAQEEERARIARDLHDDIGQRVASFSIALSRLKHEVADTVPRTAQAVARLQDQANELGDDLRSLSHDLHPTSLEHLGLLEALRAWCDEFSAGSGIAARLTVSEEWRDVPDAVALCLYRVAQEGLRNVASHARAREVTVSLDRQHGQWTMRVSDDGRGFESPPTRRPGLGLVSLAERVRMLGGGLDVASAPGRGTTLTVTIPEGARHAT
jgi:signal transduction histidine kinase